MKLLLDTHAFQWFVRDDAKLSQPARNAIENTANDVWLSVASYWEIAIKVGTGKFTLADSFDAFMPYPQLKELLKTPHCRLQHNSKQPFFR
ncbi:MAG: type II toxin-antitoxin system VapC family toxin [Planctomycetota bacterium]|nr:type II toxin-antitoxin system VapC family toxin [Planctomycetota bacterium]